MRTLVVAAIAALCAAAADFPRRVGDVDITLPDGKKVQLGDYRGKVVCLAYIVTT